jgi:uncharacterized membrane protein YphA (DoxX/SURF4 family)
MALIEIDEDSPRKSVTTAQTFLRVLVGLIVALHGAQLLMQLDQLSAALTVRFGLAAADASSLAYAIAGIELAAGAGLVLGWFTRGSAFVLICSSAPALAGALRAPNPMTLVPRLELALMLIGVGVLFVMAGGGRLSLDWALRERRRRKAIQRDAIWSQPPYVGEAPEEWTDEELDAHEFGDAAHEAR